MMTAQYSRQSKVEAEMLVDFKYFYLWLKHHRHEFGCAKS